MTHRWRSGARLGFMCFLLSAMAFGVPAFAVTSHDVNGVYHGIYREGSDYHHVWTEHFGDHSGDWDPNAYVDLTSDGGAAGGACWDWWSVPGHIHCTAWFNNPGTSYHFTSGSGWAVCGPTSTGLFADGHGDCEHEHRF